MRPCTKTLELRQANKMNSSYCKIILLPLFLGACAHVPRSGDELSAKSAQPAANVAGSVVVSEEVEKNPQPKLDLPNVAMDSQMLYEFLLGDIALQRGRPELAAQAYMDLAKSTRDPRVARRAAQLAFESRRMDKSLEAFALWQELEPSAPLASQMLVSLLLSSGKYQEARPHVEKLLALAPKGPGNVFMLIHSLLIRGPDKNAALDWLVEVARPYPELAEAHWAVAQLAAAANKKALALSEIHRAVKLHPEWDMAAMFEVQLLQSAEPVRALELLQKFSDAHPDNKDVRLFYARALLEQKRYADSRAQFQKLLIADPDNAELAFATALLSLQMGELVRAEKELQETLARGKKDADTVHYYLGQLNEAKKDNASALEQYRQVLEGDYVYSARLREAYLLNKSGKLNEALTALKSAPVADDQQQVTLVLIEAQMLRDAKQFDTSYKTLLDELKTLPNHPQLLFEAAMAADKLGKTEVFEQTLRKLLQLAPDHAQAYNALGYSFLERNVRLEEGMHLVEKAYQIEPGDAAITDSMGWGYYRLGKLDKSAEFLRRAFATNPDPEIAGHLGEVLWAQGNKAEAKKILQDAIKVSPENDVLRSVARKFIP
jgi:tetratricopeptide (TPR) repeat protein